MKTLLFYVGSFLSITLSAQTNDSESINLTGPCLENSLKPNVICDILNRLAKLEELKPDTVYCVDTVRIWIDPKPALDEAYQKLLDQKSKFGQRKEND